MNHVSQPVAQALKDAGWKGETEKVWQTIDAGTNWHLMFTHKSEAIFRQLAIGEEDWRVKRLPAPSIGELREELTLGNLMDYFDSNVKHGTVEIVWWTDYSSWLYEVTAFADHLAEVWMWKEKCATNSNNS